MPNAILKNISNNNKKSNYKEHGRPPDRVKEEATEVVMDALWGALRALTVRRYRRSKKELLQAVLLA